MGHSFGAEVAAAIAAAEHAHTTSAARFRRGQIARFLLDAPREAVLQAPILLRDVWDAGPTWDLARVTAATMIIGRARDQVVRLTGAPGDETIPHADHNVATTAAQQVADLIVRFVAATDHRVSNRPMPSSVAQGRAHVAEESLGLE